MISLSKIKLKLYSDEEVRKLAVVQVLNPSTYDRGLPKANGVNDARMGVTDKALQCPTCGLTANCNNHYGYIELEKPVIRIGHLASILCILRSVCWACSRPKFCLKKLVNFADVRAIVCRTNPGTKERLRSISEACKNKLKCPYEDCGAPQPLYSRKNKLFFERTFREKEKELFISDEEYRYASRRLMPDEIKSIIRHVPKEALILMGYNPEVNHPENYIMKAHLVPPPSIRPATSAGSTEARLRGENDLTLSLQEIVRTNNELSTYIQMNDEKKIEFGWDKLQIFCGSLINQNIKKNLTYNGESVIHARAMGKRNIKDLKKRLTGKKGRLRGNLSGKRVDHAGRSVVGPDSSHDIFQLGVPESIMNTLTFPETVTDFNMKRLGDSIKIGANKTNGALTVRIKELNEEKVLHVSLLDEVGRRRLANSLNAGYIVERHLRDGDWVLFNRQPSLHKASIMAFQAYSVKSSQFKLPLPCTKPFNADFDGDEMNLHALQDFTAIAEAQEIMSVPHQMVTPQSNSVLISLVQDSVVGAYMLSRKDSFCTYEEIMQLSMSIHYSTVSDDYLTQPMNSRSFAEDFSGFEKPAILKSSRGPMWTGKQIFSLLLPFNLSVMKAVNNSNAKNVDDILNDNVVIVRRGKLLCGRLCKQSVGNSSNGIVQAMWKQQSPWAASKFISDAQRLLMQWLKKDTICISVRDCVTDADKTVDNIVIEAMKKNNAIESADVPSEIKEIKQTQIMQDCLKNAGLEVLRRMDFNCGISNVVGSGAKGNVMNIAQIGGLVGQQTINGSRIAFRKGPIGKRTLASFSPNDNSPQARGFVSSSYLMGLQPSEFFFHQQAGREGVVATAVSTADTGYNQRRMIKNQESEVVSYDLSVRVSSNLIVQLHYGGDDYDGTLVERVKIPKDSLNVVANKILENREEVTMPANIERIIACCMIQEEENNEDICCPFDILKDIFSFILTIHDSKCVSEINTYQCIDDFLLRPARDVITSDDPSFLTRACIALQCNEQYLQSWKVTKKSSKKIVSEFNRLYSKAIVNPGEGVGAVGSSSIGEPSTQMTLNIFHYSGIAEKNVTLTGLPRFKQIINAVDTYDTSNMHIELNEKMDKYKLRSFAARLARCTLSDIIVSSEVYNISSKTSLEILEQVNELSKLSQKGKYSSYTAKFVLDKNKTSSRYLNIEDVGENLKKYLENAHVTYTSNFCHDWILLVTPPSFSEDASYDQVVTETVHDSLLDTALINGLEYIKKAIPVNEAIETEGSDLISLSELMEVNPLKTTTNNIIETMNILGIEAALALMQSELHRVLSFDGSYVDPRHTWLLADTVGRSGNINPLNRHKMEELGGSLLQCASFEQTLEVFEHGAAFGKEDNLGGATEKLIVGQPVHVGTGSFAIVGDIEAPSYEVVPALRSNQNNIEDESVQPLFPKFHLFSSEERVERMQIDDDETEENDQFVDLVSYMRKMAHRRIPVWIIAEICDLQESQYNVIEKNLEKYSGWNEKPDYELITKVEYMVNEDLVVTERNQHKITSIEMTKEIEINNFKVITRTECRTYFDNDSMPVCVEPKNVTYKQTKLYKKGAWDIELVRSFSASSILEAEDLMKNRKNAVYRISVILERPWDLLESKGSHDLFISSMFVDKLIMCLDYLN